MRTLTAFLFCFTLLASASFAAEDEKSFSVPVGDLEVLSILDAHVNMDSSLLPQLGKYPELSQLFSHGPLPAVTRTWYLHTGDHKILFDTGWGADQKIRGETKEILKEKGIAPEAITDVVLTHLDFDHIGGLLENGRVVFPNATIWVSRPEYEAWIKGEMHRRPDFAKKLAKEVGEVYKDQIKLFDFGQEILPGVKAIDASGHTPGHTAYEISSGDSRLLILGDAIHIAQVQFLKPELSTIYDAYPEQAAKTRARLLEKAVNENSAIGGMHFERVSPVRKRDDGGFAIMEPR